MTDLASWRERNLDEKEDVIPRKSKAMKKKITKIIAMKHKIKKPVGTFYSDYTIQGNKCFAIFEKTDGRKETKFVCQTKKTNEDWRTFQVKETKNYLTICLGE